MKQKTAAMLAACAIAATAIAGCGGSAGGNDDAGADGGDSAGRATKLVRMGTTASVDSINPFVSASALGYALMFSTYPTLVSYGPGLKVEPALASSWRQSDGGRHYTFTLRSAKWSDGTPITSADVAWTLGTVLRYASGPTAALASNLTNLERVRAVGPRAVELTYAKPTATALTGLAFVWIVPEHVWQPVAGADGRGLSTYRPEDHQPIVAGGPFAIERFDSSGTTILKRNPEWWGEPALAERVGLQFFTNADAELEALRSGGLDVTDASFQATSVAPARRAGLAVDSSPSLRQVGLAFNSNPRRTRHRELLDPKVRRAFSLAIDRDEIVRVSYAGQAEPAASIVYPASGDWTDPSLRPDPVDLDEANRLLDEAGYERAGGGTRTGADGQPMSYRVTTLRGVPGMDRTFETVRDGLASIGVEVVNNPVDPAQFYPTTMAPNGRYDDNDLSIAAYLSLPDPDSMLVLVTCGQRGGLSDTGYCDPRLERLYAEQAGAVDDRRRHELIVEAQQLLNETKPYAWLVGLNLLSARREQMAPLNAELFGLSWRPLAELGPRG